ncbi:ABC transporter ATP-binding protein [Pantanalinema rosaneae CENA516]|uniref:ABC transporter ATP-binding protein n=1 Tax=Pantanalinema rosaneae TaxID=1620701 RepID=UPI003D6EE135
MSDPVIQVQHLGKKYLLRHQQPQHYVALRDVISNGAKSIARRILQPGRSHPAPDREEFWALQDVSFEVNQGDRVGIIGRNGAGKSTLLKLLSRITEPTTGQITLNGRVASLLEVGTGFHPELTGRENIYLNGAILGMSKVEIKRKFDEIVAFAEVEKFLDTPVKHYSSGMYVRLAFAVAAHLEPEILIVDEVLAVGDAQFQKKCLGKMEDVSKSGRTLLFVSHNMGTITQLCSRGIYLNQGKISAVGDINSVVSTYLASGANSEVLKILYPAHVTPPDATLFFREIGIFQADELASEIDIRFPFSVYLKYESIKPLRNVELSMRIETDDGRAVFTSHQSDCTPDSVISRQPGCYSISIQIPAMFLMPGNYMLTVGAHEPMVQVYDLHANVLHFRVNETGTKLAKYGHHRQSGVVMINLPWTETLSTTP